MSFEKCEENQILFSFFLSFFLSLWCVDVVELKDDVM
jgi:hypothetical protein